MPSQDRRAAGRRRAWGRGPIILRFEPLEGRQLLAANAAPRPDIVGTAFDTLHNLDWGDNFRAVGSLTNVGDAPTDRAFRVGIFASNSAVIGPGSIVLGTVTVPSGLQPGQTYQYAQDVALPNGPIPGMGSSNLVWVGTRIDPDFVIAESNKVNNEGRGQGFDISVVTITPRRPSNLIGTSFGVFPDVTAWGGEITVTAQIRNDAAGDAPATRARLVLTPAGVTPGGPSDVTIGSISVPAIAARQQVNLVQQLTLPAGPPSGLTASTQFVLSMIQDADFAANVLGPHVTTEGRGFDFAVIAIGPGPNGNIPPGPKPDLAESTVVAPTLPVAWGQGFQVATTVTNLGQVDSPAYEIRYYLTGLNASLDRAVYLGRSELPAGLKAGFSQDIAQTLRLPNRLPAIVDVENFKFGRVVAVVDPENTIDENLQTNNFAASGPVALRLVAADGSSIVPLTTPKPVVTTPKPAPRPTAPKPNAPKPRPRKPGPGTGRPKPGAPRPASAKRRLEATRPRTDREKAVKELKVFPRRVSRFLSDLAD